MLDTASWSFLDGCRREGLTPPPIVGPREWAEANRVMTGTSANAGLYSTRITPYWREPLAMLSKASPVRRVVIMAAAQTGKSEVGLNTLGAMIHHDPCLALLVLPTVDAARRMVHQRLDPMIRDTPALASRVVREGSRKGGNSATSKAYPGGVLSIVGANSPVGLRSTPAKLAVCDEVDAFPLSAGDEGDPVKLLEVRAITFPDAKLLLVSTPTEKALSRINAAYLETDQRKLHWPCVHCGEHFIPSWDLVQWSKAQPGKAVMICPCCGGVLTEHHKRKMLEGCRWVATAQGDGVSAGFHMPGCASPFLTWATIAREREQAEGDVNRLKVWTNTMLGEIWEDREGTPVEADHLMARAEVCETPWTELLPDEAVAITMGCDVQADRIECEVVAWGRGERSWSIDYQVCWGDTSQDAVWDQLDRLIRRRFRHPRAVPDLAVSAVAIDAGFRTDRVLRFCQNRANLRVWPVKGRAGPGVRLFPTRPPKPRRGAGMAVSIVGVDSAKMTIMSRLRITEPGPGHCAFPADRDRDWYQQLTSERLVRKVHGGKWRHEWVADRTIRNEALDARTYSYSALHGLYARGLSLDEMAAKIAAASIRASDERSETPQKAGVTVIRSKFLGG